MTKGITLYVLFLVWIITPENTVGNFYCGVPNKRNGEGNIEIDGREAGIAEYPWQVALLEGPDVASKFCGGTLVSDRHVVTAAHCTMREFSQGLFVAVGDTNFAINSEIASFIIAVKAIKQHPNFEPSTSENDISVLELAEPLDIFAHPHIKPICLPAKNAIYDNYIATVTGWGSSNKIPTANLRRVNVQILADDTCVTMIGGNDKICAQALTSGEDSCLEDIGGPLIVEDPANNGGQTLAGVVNGEFGCPIAGQPGIYSKVSGFRTWLDQEIYDGNTGSPNSEDMTDFEPDKTDFEADRTCANLRGGGFFETVQNGRGGLELKYLAAKQSEDCAQTCADTCNCYYYATYKETNGGTSKWCRMYRITFTNQDAWKTGYVFESAGHPGGCVHDEPMGQWANI